MAAPCEASFATGDATLHALIRPVIRRLPHLHGEPIRVERVPGLRDGRGPVHAGAFLKERRIAFDCARREFPRIFVHELFHFVWVRASNQTRHSYEHVLLAELARRAKGELGWSAEWRKLALHADDGGLRNRRWREYCCESLCDTAAWYYSGVGLHSEFTLPQTFRKYRRQWLVDVLGASGLSI